MLLHEKPENDIDSIRLLQTSEEFEVRYGRWDFITEKALNEERDEEHLKDEAAVELMLMPDASLGKRKESSFSDGGVQHRAGHIFYLMSWR